MCTDYEYHYNHHWFNEMNCVYIFGAENKNRMYLWWRNIFGLKKIERNIFDMFVKLICVISNPNDAQFRRVPYHKRRVVYYVCARNTHPVSKLGHILELTASIHCGGGNLGIRPFPITINGTFTWQWLAKPPLNRLYVLVIIYSCDYWMPLFIHAINSTAVYPIDRSNGKWIVDCASQNIRWMIIYKSPDFIWNMLIKWWGPRWLAWMIQHTGK